MSGSLRLPSTSLPAPLLPAREERQGEAREERPSKVAEAPEAPGRVNMLLGQKRVTR